MIAEAIKVPVLRVGVPNGNNNVYTEECVRRALDSFTKASIPVLRSVDCYQSGVQPKLEDVIGEASNPEIKNGWLHVDVQFASTEADVARFIRDGSLAIRTAGTGVLNGTVVEDYVLEGLFATNEPS